MSKALERLEAASSDECTPSNRQAWSISPAAKALAKRARTLFSPWASIIDAHPLVVVRNAELIDIW